MEIEGPNKILWDSISIYSLTKAMSLDNIALRWALPIGGVS